MNIFSKFLTTASRPFYNFTGNKYFQSLVQYIGFDNLLYDTENKVELINKGYATTNDVYAIVSKIARSGASLDWYVEEVFDDGNTERVYNSKANEILECPNRLETWSEFMETHLTYRLTTGDSYIYGLQPEGFPYFAELNNLQSQYVVIVAGDSVNPILGYRMNWDTKIKYTNEEVLHLYYSNPSAYQQETLYGMSPLKASSKVWHTSNERWIASANVIKNKGITGILSDESERPMTPEQAKILQDGANKRIGGSDKFGQVMVSNKQLRYIQMGLSPSDLQLLDQGIISLRALCNAYHVDSSLFNDPANKTFNNRKEAEKSFWSEAVIPEMIKTMNGLNNWLMPSISEFENRNLRLRFDTSKIEALQQDRSLVADRVTKLRLAGIISGNDARRELGLDEIEDESMNSVYIPQNQVDITNEEQATE